MALQDNIDYSIKLLQKAEKLALSMSDDGFHVGFSGGKDSQVLLELVKMSGVKYTAEYSVTGNDPPDNVHFIREEYPEVIWYHPPKKFIPLVALNGLPLRHHRYCCALLKEGRGEGKVVLTGVRAEESVRRRGYSEVALHSHKGKAYGGARTIEQVEENQHRCVGGKDKLMIYPILKWTERDVWDFIKQRNLPINPCYQNHGRVGCMMCPFANYQSKQRYLKEYPHLRQTMINAIQRYLDSGRGGKITKLGNAEEVFNMWLSGDSVDNYIAKKRQLSLDLFFQQEITTSNTALHHENN